MGGVCSNYIRFQRNYESDAESRAVELFWEALMYLGSYRYEEFQLDCIKCSFFYWKYIDCFLVTSEMML